MESLCAYQWDESTRHKPGHNDAQVRAELPLATALPLAQATVVLLPEVYEDLLEEVVPILGRQPCRAEDAVNEGGVPADERVARRHVALEHSIDQGAVRLRANILDGGPTRGGIGAPRAGRRRRSCCPFSLCFLCACTG